MEKDELAVSLKMSRNSLTEKVLSGPSESLTKHPTIVNEVYKLLGTQCLTFLLVLKMVLTLCPLSSEYLWPFLAGHFCWAPICNDVKRNIFLHCEFLICTCIVSLPCKWVIINCCSSQMEDSSGSFPGKEEMELSLQKLDKDLKETRRERDKALQELGRLKQHLLEKVTCLKSLIISSKIHPIFQLH